MRILKELSWAIGISMMAGAFVFLYQYLSKLFPNSEIWYIIVLVVIAFLLIIYGANKK